MRLSTKGRYSVRAMADLAKYGKDRPVTISELAKREELSFAYIEQLFVKLKKAGFLKSVRGAEGGWLLAKPPSLITVGDILRVVEGPLSPVFCVDTEKERKKTCPRSKGCLTRPLWEKLRKKMSGVLDKTTLADLAEEKIA
ncbi:MAG: Rrf2 family transcriptional regulator [bacterium]